MVLPVALITGLLRSVLGGTLSTIIDAYVSDLELRRKIKADLDHAPIEEFGELLSAQRDVVLAKVNSQSWLTRSWRPLLMLLLMGLLVVCGPILPSAELLVSHHIDFRPRWELLPPELWDVMVIAMGGYVGGRSLEKIATAVTASRGVANAVKGRR
jgi:hypothetical protein